jgi:hypothetical protein
MQEINQSCILLSSVYICEPETFYVPALVHFPVLRDVKEGGTRIRFVM